jgi:hypothetical protein
MPPFVTTSPGLSREDAHATFDAAVAGLPTTSAAGRPRDFPTRRGNWSNISESRSTTSSIFAAIRPTRSSPGRRTTGPATAAPPSPAAWGESLRRFREDRAALQQLARDPAIDLAARIPHGTGQTYLRELLLVADHSAYHVGELIVVRRLLGAWPAS